MSKRTLSRRTVLHGMGTTLALPLLDAMFPSVCSAATDMVPARFFAFFQPAGSYTGNKLTGNPHEFWYPYQNKITNVPLALLPLKNQMSDLWIVTNLECKGIAPTQSFGEIPPFGHGRASTGFLTCSQAIRGADDYKTVRVGHDSLDHVIIRKSTLGGAFTGGSYVVGLTSTQAPADNYTTPEYCANVSYRDSKSYPAMRTTKDIMTNFFLGIGNGTNTATKEANVPNTEMEHLKEVYGKSYLDYMKDSIGALKKKLGTSDTRILNDYLEEVYEMEKTAAKINASAGSDGGGGGDAMGMPACTAPAAGPNGQPETAFASQFYIDFANFAVKAAVLGMKCDRVRVGAMMYGNESTHINYRNIIKGADCYGGVSLDGGRHLEAAHHANDPVRIKRLLSIHHLEIKIFKGMLDALKATPEAGGTMLDSTVMMLGGNLADGNSHGGLCPRICAGGKKLGIVQGRVTDAKGAPLANLHLEIANRMNCGIKSFGTKNGLSTGRLNLG